MKRKILIKGIIIVSLLSFIGCEKDMRDKYVGNWDFVTEKRFFRRDSITYISLDKKEMIYYSGKIRLGNVADQLIVQFAEDEAEIKAILDKEGSVWQSLPAYYDVCHKCSFGRFTTKNTVELTFHTGGTDNDIWCIIEYATTGTKQKGDKK